MKDESNAMLAAPAAKADPMASAAGRLALPPKKKKAAVRATSPQMKKNARWQDLAKVVTRRAPFQHTNVRLARYQWLALHDEALGRVNRGETNRPDLSAVIRDLVDEWMEKHGKPRREED